MSTLFERLSGIGLDPDLGEKIPIHVYSGAINELRRGKVTGVEIAAMFNLDASQVSDSIALKDLIVAAPNKTEFMRVFKDCLYMAESGYAYLT